MKNCSICGKPIILVPSAKERSERYGKPTSYYESLFTEHAECTLNKREQDTLSLIRKLNGEKS